jgi:hypothetical protein
MSMDVDTARFEYSFEFNRAEHLRACRAIHKHAIRNPWSRGIFLGTLWLFGIMFVINIRADLQRKRFPVMLPGLIALASISAIPFINFYVSARKWEKRNPAGHRTVTINVSNAGFHTSSFWGSTDLRWEAILQVVEIREFFLFYVARKVAYYLPKRVMTAQDTSGVRRVVLVQISPAHVHMLADKGRAS